MLAVAMAMATAAVPQTTPALTTSLSLALKSWANLLSLVNLKTSWHALCLSVPTPQSVNMLIDTRTSCHRHLRPLRCTELHHSGTFRTPGTGRVQWTFRTSCYGVHGSLAKKRVAAYSAA